MQRTTLTTLVLALGLALLTRTTHGGEIGHYVPGLPNIRDFAMPAPGFYGVLYHYFYTSDRLNDGKPDARDYVYSYGFRNPFGGGWREASGSRAAQLWVVENGPSLDRLSKVVRGQDQKWDGTDVSMRNFNIAYTPNGNFSDGAPDWDPTCSNTCRIRSRGGRPSSAAGRSCAAKAVMCSSRLAVRSSSLLSKSWYMDRFDTPAALHSASTPTPTPSW